MGLGIFLFTTVSRPVLGPTQLPITWLPEALTLGVKRRGREADHSPLHSAEIRNAWSCTSPPPIRPHRVVLGWNILVYMSEFPLSEKNYYISIARWMNTEINKIMFSFNRM
jgi:hypothetical protein